MSTFIPNTHLIIKIFNYLVIYNSENYSHIIRGVNYKRNCAIINVLLTRVCKDWVENVFPKVRRFGYTIGGGPIVDYSGLINQSLVGIKLELQLTNENYMVLDESEFQTLFNRVIYSIKYNNKNLLHSIDSKSQRLERLSIVISSEVDRSLLVLKDRFPLLLYLHVAFEELVADDSTPFVYPTTNTLKDLILTSRSTQPRIQLDHSSMSFITHLELENVKIISSNLLEYIKNTSAIKRLLLYQNTYCTSDFNTENPNDQWAEKFVNGIKIYKNIRKDEESLECPYTGDGLSTTDSLFNVLATHISIEFLQLKECNIKLKSLIQCLNQNKSLKTIIFSYIKLSEFPITDEIENTTLEEFTLYPPFADSIFKRWKSNSGIKLMMYLDSDSLVPCIHGCHSQSLEKLYLTKSGDIQDLKQIMTMPLPNLKHLIFTNGSPFTEPKILLSNNTIQSVNFFIEQKASVLEELISICHPTLKSITFSLEFKSLKRVEDIINALSNNPYLEYFKICNSYTVPNTDVNSLCKLLNNQNLHNIHFPMKHTQDFIMGNFSTFSQVINENLHHLYSLFLSNEFTEIILKGFLIRDI
ncbi:hypothetical protein DLAC_06455 [Tieghemostelium lacteum]|uniref:Uncharacterized protein n=1 Tax=Tieghemostelium lacteum TaxID=361077 RepID=A0A151ZET5_TIELA|nr:hypothetical protein DLAC_06455 [Tieghemostelium lacteum]|eukprot:KYQ92471.1 hypothetical protein DLAC_06455 [Tieghemostelium lacteum]